MIENVRVKIGDAHARAAGAHEFINGFREKSLDSESHLVGQIFSERAFSGGRIVEGSNAGKQKQVVIAKRVGSENHEIGRLKNFFARFVNVGHAARFAAVLRGLSCTMRRTVAPVRKVTFCVFSPRAAERLSAVL